MMFSILENYLNKIILCTTGIVMLVLVSLSSIIRLINELYRIKNGNFFIEVVMYIILSIPRDIELFFTISILLGTLLGFGSLFSSNEFIAIESSGFGVFHFIKMIMKVSIFIIFIMIIISEWLSPISGRYLYDHFNRFIYTTNVINIRENLWLQSNYDFIFVRKVMSKNNLLDIDIYQFNHKKELQALIYAKRACYNHGSWSLFNVNTFLLNSGINIINTQHFNIHWNTILTPSMLSAVLNLRMHNASFYYLYNYIKYLKYNKHNPVRYQLFLYKRIVYPFTVMFLMIFAVACVFSFFAYYSRSMQLLFSIAFSFLFYMLDQLFGIMCLSLYITPVVGVFLPWILCLVISIFMLKKYC